MERPTEEWFRIVEKMSFKTGTDYRKYLRRLRKLPNQASLHINVIGVSI